MQVNFNSSLGKATNFIRVIRITVLQAKIDEERKRLMETSQLAEEEHAKVMHILAEQEKELQSAALVFLSSRKKNLCKTYQ